MKDRANLAVRYSTIAVGLLVTCWAVSTCIPQPKVWQRLAEVAMSNGDRIVIGQEHYDWFEGWKVCLFVIEKTGVCYFDTLETESASWSDVSLVQSNDTVEVWLQGRRYGVYELSSRKFAGPKWSRLVTHRFNKSYSNNPFPVPIVEKP